MSSPEARAAEVIDHVGDEPSNVVAAALATEGLLTPEPKIIRTRDELAVLDPDTVLFDVDDPWREVRMSASEWMEDYAIDAEGIFPLAVIATGEQVRAAREALKGEP